MKYKVGDIVIYKGQSAIVLKVFDNRYLIQLSDQYLTVSGLPVQTWVSCLDIRLDKQYYRNIKLKKLGI
jgi:hypothetical protein